MSISSICDTPIQDSSRRCCARGSNGGTRAAARGGGGGAPSLDEVVPSAGHSLLERDGAILRLIYSFEAVWKACQQLLGEHEGIEVASPNGTIRAARRLGWLSDDDAQVAIGVGRDRNLAVHMYRGEIGAEIAQRLASHAALLRRWLDALRRRSADAD